MAGALTGKTLMVRVDRGRVRQHVRFSQAPRSLPEPVQPGRFITRLRLDAALYEPAPPRNPGQMGTPSLKDERLPNLSAVAKDPSTAWTKGRHLEVETQRPWSELAIRRTTPALLGLFSLITLFAHQRMAQTEGVVR